MTAHKQDALYNFDVNEADSILVQWDGITNYSFSYLSSSLQSTIQLDTFLHHSIIWVKFVSPRTFISSTSVPYVDCGSWCTKNLTSVVTSYLSSSFCSSSSTYTSFETMDFSLLNVLLLYSSCLLIWNISISCPFLDLVSLTENMICSLFQPLPVFLYKSKYAFNGAKLHSTGSICPLYICIKFAHSITENTSAFMKLIKNNQFWGGHYFAYLHINCMCRWNSLNWFWIHQIGL